MILRSRGAKAPLLSVDLMPARVALNLRESGAVFPCKWCSVAEIYTGQVLICICRVQNSEMKLCALQILYNEKEYNDESNWFPQVLSQGE